MAGFFTGPAYPFGATATSVFGPADDVAVLATSIVNILTTPKNTYAPDPNVGSMVPYMLFEPLDGVTLQTIRHFTVKDLGEQETRAVVVQALTDVPDVDAQEIVVSVGFQRVGDPTARTYVVPVDMPVLEG